MPSMKPGRKTANACKKNSYDETAGNWLGPAGAISQALKLGLYGHGKLETRRLKPGLPGRGIHGTWKQMTTASADWKRRSSISTVPISRWTDTAEQIFREVGVKKPVSLDAAEAVYKRVAGYPRPG